MKKVLRIIVVEFAGLVVANELASGLSFQNAVEGVVITSLALGLAMHVIKPLINVLLLPLTLATMGAFKIIGHAITLFIVDVALTQFEVTGFYFAGFTSEYFDVPPIIFEKGPFAYLSFSIVIWFVTGVINWLRK